MFPALPAHLETFLATLIPRLWHWAHGRLPPTARRRIDTGDLVQESLISAMRSLGEIQTLDRTKLRNYLEACIRNRIRDEIRRAELGEVTNCSSVVVRDTRQGPLEDAVDSEERAAFRHGLAALNERDQVLVVGRIELGLTWEELAIVAGHQTVQATRSATRRAMLRLARQMGSRAT